MTDGGLNKLFRIGGRRDYHGWYLKTFDCFQHSVNLIRFYIRSLDKCIPTPHSLKNGDGLLN